MNAYKTIRLNDEEVNRLMVALHWRVEVLRNELDWVNSGCTYVSSDYKRKAIKRDVHVIENIADRLALAEFEEVE